MKKRVVLASAQRLTVAEFRDLCEEMEFKRYIFAVRYQPDFMLDGRFFAQGEFDTLIITLQPNRIRLMNDVGDLLFACVRYVLAYEISPSAFRFVLVCGTDTPDVKDSAYVIIADR